MLTHGLHFVRSQSWFQLSHYVYLTSKRFKWHETFWWEILSSVYGLTCAAFAFQELSDVVNVLLPVNVFIDADPFFALFSKILLSIKILYLATIGVSTILIWVKIFINIIPNMYYIIGNWILFSFDVNSFFLLFVMLLTREICVPYFQPDEIENNGLTKLFVYPY